MMKLFHLNFERVCIVFLLFVVQESSAQSLNISWQKRFGGQYVDWGRAIIQTRDGGYLIAGNTSDNRPDAHGSGDIILIKMDKDGNIRWNKVYGGSSTDNLESKDAVQETQDGGFIVVGTTGSRDGQVTNSHDTTNLMGDAWIFKIDSVGTLEWEKSFGGTGDEHGTALQVTTDSAVIVTGVTSSNDGDISGIHGAPVGGYYYYDFFVVKMDLHGNVKWQKTFGGSKNDVPRGIKKTNDGNYMLFGTVASDDGDITTKPNGSSSDIWLIKLNGNGSIIWNKCIGGSGNEQDCSFIQNPNDPSSGFMLAMTNYSINGDFTGISRLYDFCLLSLDSVGNIKWKKSYGGSRGDVVTDIRYLRDDSYVITGATSSNDGDVGFHYGAVDTIDAWFLNVNDTGKILYKKVLGGTSLDITSGILPTDDSGFILIGATSSVDGDLSGIASLGNFDLWLVKFARPGSTGITGFVNNDKVRVYPTVVTNKFNIDPGNSNVHFDVLLYDMTGKSVVVLMNKSNRLIVDLGNLPSGIYTLYIKMKNGVQCEKLIKY